MSALAVLGVIVVLLFEAFFVFEIYNRAETMQLAPVAEESVPVG
jgi:hypothetical protein